MGILNATPDSFSGDGIANDDDAIIARARAHIKEGADLLDIGGESSRPGSTPVPLEEELRRVTPIVRWLAANGNVPFSIDTVKPAVAEMALRAGARIVNDVSGLAEPRLASLAADHGAYLVLMHNGWSLEARGIPERGDPIERVVREVERLAAIAERTGVGRDRLIADPGIGFGKTPDESLMLIARTGELRRRLAPLPLMIGPSRKRFIGHVLDAPIEERSDGTLACVAVAAFEGATIIRVHDVAPAVRASRVAWALGARRSGVAAPE
jgi:dihydropteroate synthase